MATPGAEAGTLLDVSGAAAHLGVSTAFVRRLVLEKRIRYYKVGKFVRFRPADLDAFVEAGRQDPAEIRVHRGSPLDRGVRRHSTRELSSRSPLGRRQSPERAPQRRRDS